MAIYGDTSGILRHREAGGNQDIALENSIGGTAYGDADQMLNKSRGGDDTLTGGAFTTNILFGDADTRHSRLPVHDLTG